MGRVWKETVGFGQRTGTNAGEVKGTTNKILSKEKKIRLMRGGWKFGTKRVNTCKPDRQMK